MGREATITYEQVAAAADAVKVAGGKPTSRGIRERLGNTGSMGTEQQAAVLGAKLEGTNERTGKAEAAAQARKHGEAVFAEAAKIEAAKNTISNLTGKLEAMQAQIERQAGELDVARQGAATAGGEAAELRGKPAAKPRR